MRQTLSKCYSITYSPSSTSHALLNQQCALKKGDADSQFKICSDTAESSDIIHDVRGMNQEVKVKGKIGYLKLSKNIVDITG